MCLFLRRRMMKKFITLLLFLMISQSWAFNFWPGGSGPCAATLQTCIDDSPEGELIEIRTNNPIKENIFTNNAVSLIAGAGYKPTFSAGRGLFFALNTAVSRSITIRGLKLLGGTISINHLGASNTVVIENNLVLDNNNDFPGISIISSSNADLSLKMNYNIVNNTFSDDTDQVGAISVRKLNGDFGRITGQIYGNEIKSAGAESIGVFLSDETDGLIDLNITGNEIYGGAQGGLLINRVSGLGVMDIDVTSNSFYKLNVQYPSSGVHVVNESGISNVDIVNNTMLDGLNGILASESIGSSVTMNVFNNIVAYANTGFNFGIGVEVENDYNLYHANAVYNNYVPGPNSLQTDPLIKNRSNGRLKLNSPAINAGNAGSFFFVADAPLVDADGTFRFKSVFGPEQVDIGAYEFGDVNFWHRQSESGTHLSTVDNINTNGLFPLDNLFVTSVFNPEQTGGVINNANEGIFYDNIQNKWVIFNQENEIDINFSAAFNVSKLGSVSRTFRHENTSGGINSTELDRTGLNGNSDLILQVTQTWNGVNNRHPVAVIYFAGKWRIANTDLADMPVGAVFNVFYHPQSKSAWEHIVVEGNSSGGVTELDHPLLNGVPCAQLQVTQSASQGVFNDSPIGVSFFANRWRVFNQKPGVPMPLNAAFHVLINPEQIAECNDLIFKDGFE